MGIVEDLRLFFCSRFSTIGQLATMAGEADAHSYFTFVRFADGFLHFKESYGLLVPDCFTIQGWRATEELYVALPISGSQDLYISGVICHTRIFSITRHGFQARGINPKPKSPALHYMDFGKGR